MSEQQPVLLDRRTIEALYGFSRSTIERLIKEGLFPQPIRAGESRTVKNRWFRSEVEAAVASWPRGTAA